MAQQSIEGIDILVPLQEWIEDEAKKQVWQNENKYWREWIIRKTTIAFGITELLRHSRNYSRTDTLSFSIENFSVRINIEQTAGRFSQPTWNNIKGVDMISPQLSSDIVEPFFLCNSFLFPHGSDDAEDQILGRYLEVIVQTLPDGYSTASTVNQIEESCCHSLGVLLYELFSHSPPLQDAGLGNTRLYNKESQLESNDVLQEPVRKRTRLSDSTAIAAQSPSFEEATEENQETPFSPHIPLMKLGFPASISMLVQNLLECRGGNDNSPEGAYESLETVSKDLHLLLLDPNHVLFDQEPISENGSVQLLFRKQKLYGREDEISLITDAFCRVSSGKSEAVFIGGFSGSGKSRLANSLTDRVDTSGGYVITHKFDQKPEKDTETLLLEVISTINDLCLLIKEKSAQQDLLAIVKDLKEVFGTDFSLLTRLLPSIGLISSQLGHVNMVCDQTDLPSVCLTLQRFMGVVSSKAHPIMLFFDDLQWCDDSAFSLIENILSDASGSSCLLFVGAYRSNQVQDNHAIFSLIDSLSSSGLPTTTLGLEGLPPGELTTMVSDAMCMFPRMCKRLADIIFQKTKGNPFFVQQFLSSLLDASLLEYSVQKRRWVWDEEAIKSMDVTDNVLFGLLKNMTRLSENAKLTLKVVACLETMKESTVRHLSTISEYSNIQSELERVIEEGFIVKVGTSDFKFVHKEVHEAAYGLIPDNEKNRFHYSLGMTLYSMIKKEDVDDIIFSIADQVNRGIEDLSIQSPELRLDLADLNEIAGMKAMNSDYMAACSYLNTALLMLPTNPWRSQYARSLRLFSSLAKSTYSCGDMKKAQDILQEILGECNCIEDKLPAYFLQVTILNACGESVDAYSTCREVLSQLRETIPQRLEPRETTQMIKATLKMSSGLSLDSLLEMKGMAKKFSITLKFYNFITTIAFFTKPEIFAFLACKSFQLTMKQGICKYSILGLVLYAAAIISGSKTMKDTQEASRIGKAAMSCFKKRFHSADQLSIVYFAYFGLVAAAYEPLQSCAEMLRQGFDAGMSDGDPATALLNSIQHVNMALIAGEKLSALFDKVNYYLELADLHKHELGKTFLSIFRDTISVLIDTRESTSSNMNNTTSENGATKLANNSGTVYFHRAIQAFCLGHSERCQHFIEKVQVGSATEKLGKMVVMFIHGLNSFQVLKRQNTSKLRKVTQNALTALKAAALHSKWNFKSKVHLLEAEFFSFHGNCEEAKASYAAAVTSARSSRFIHEQGLACELAGFHYKKIGEISSARDFFNQAKQCYADWGSQMKVGFISRQLETVDLLA